MTKDTKATNKNMKKLQKQEINERYNELEKLLSEKIVSKGTKKENLTNLLRDKNILNQEAFEQSGDKQFGLSAGYVAKEKDTDNTFILKQFYKDSAIAIKQDQEETKKTGGDNKWRNFINIHDGVRELLASGLYSLLLYDRTPKEELVIADKVNKDSLYVRSKFFKTVKPLDKFSGASNTDFNPSSPNVAKLEGFEKVIAACNILGEIDYHAGNLMVQKQQQDNSTNKYIVTKIDHGKSFSAFNKDLKSLTENLYQSFKLFKYTPKGQVENLKFDVVKYASAIEQMTKQLTDDQIDSVIGQKISELQKSGFNPKGMMPRNSADQVIEIDDYQQLSNHYKNELKTNLQNMKEISKHLTIISKYSNVVPEFKEGAWLKTFAESKEKDPVLYAVNHNIEIEGKNPLTWTKENNYQISYPSSISKPTWEKSWEKHGKTWTEGYKKVSKEQTIITPIDPIEQLLANNANKDLKDLPESLANFLIDEVYTKKTPEYKKYAKTVKNCKIKIPDDVKYTNVPEMHQAINDLKNNYKRTLSPKNTQVVTAKKTNLRGL